MKLIRLIVWLMIGAVPGYFGLGYLNETRSYISNSVEAPAQISQFQFENLGTADHTDNDFRIWVSFDYVDGTPSSAPTNVLSSNDLHRLGEEVTILYNPEFVGTVRIKSFMSLWLLPAIFLGMAGLIWGLGVWRSLA